MTKAGRQGAAARPLVTLIWMLVLAFCSPCGRTWAEAGLPMQAQQVSPHVWYVQGASALGNSANQNFISNAAFVVTPAGVVVVDALGAPVLGQRLLAQIRKVTDKPVVRVIVTHYHADHIYGLQSLKVTGARVLAGAQALDYLNSDTARKRLSDSRQTIAPWIDDKTHLVRPDEWITGPRNLSLGGIDLEIQPVGPAHTAEDLVVYVRQDRVLVAGDLVFRQRVPFVGEADSGRWIEALDKLLAYDLVAIVPGHGPLSREPSEDMRLTRDYLAFLRQAMGTAAHNMDPFDEAYRATDWGRFASVPLFEQANRMNAYNTYLLMERQDK